MRDIDRYTHAVLAHAQGYKYIKREKVNGKWRYTYEKDAIGGGKQTKASTEKKGIRGVISNIGDKLGVDDYRRTQQAKSRLDTSRTMAKVSSNQARALSGKAQADRDVAARKEAAVKKAHTDMTNARKAQEAGTGSVQNYAKAYEKWQDTVSRSAGVGARAKASGGAYDAAAAKAQADAAKVKRDEASYKLAKHDLAKTPIGALLNAKDKVEDAASDAKKTVSSWLNSGKKWLDSAADNVKDFDFGESWDKFWGNDKRDTYKEAARDAWKKEDNAKSDRAKADRAAEAEDRYYKVASSDNKMDLREMESWRSALDTSRHYDAIAKGSEKKATDSRKAADEAKAEYDKNRRGKIESSIDAAEDWLKKLFKNK